MNLEATDIKQTSAMLAWSPPDNDGGSEVTHYIVEKREIDRKTWATVKAQVDKDKVPLKVSGLMPGTEYYFRVTAVNEYGPGVPRVSPTSYLASDPVSAYQAMPHTQQQQAASSHHVSIHSLETFQHTQFVSPPVGKPDPCEKIEVLEITKNSATVGWVRPARDGGAKIDGYVIEYIEVKPPPEPPAPVQVCHLSISPLCFHLFLCYRSKKDT